MSKTQDFVGTLVVKECPVCHVTYGIPQAMNDRCFETGASWFCPNGHSLIFKTTELQKARQEAADLKNRLEWARKAEAEQREYKEAARRSLSATRGVITRLKNSAAAGKCPCCGKQYVQLHKHMSKAHPEFLSRDEEGEG